MRASSQILIFINLQEALDADINFFLSDNGVILTEAWRWLLKPESFERVEGRWWMDNLVNLDYKYFGRVRTRKLQLLLELHGIYNR